MSTSTGVAVDDARVIERSRAEPEYFALLFRRHAPLLQRYVTRRLGPQAAEDVVNEVFLVAFRQRRSYDLSRADARPWLYGIATNLVGRHRRGEVRAGFAEGAVPRRAAAGGLGRPDDGVPAVQPGPKGQETCG